MADYVQLEGQVEVDETYIGGKDWFRGRKWWSNYREVPKTAVLGLIQRGGKVKTSVIDFVDSPTLISNIKMYTKPGTEIITDSHWGYRPLPKHGYPHKTVNHSLQFVNSQDPQAHIQNIEGFWSQMRRGITGTYRNVSNRYLTSYCNEFTFRHNHRSQVLQDLLGKLAYPELPF